MAATNVCDLDDTGCGTGDVCIAGADDCSTDVNGVEVDEGGTGEDVDGSGRGGGIDVVV